MSPSSQPDPALSFAAVADIYDRVRPSYPLEAAEWMTGRLASTVVELGAGTGKFTDRLVELGHDVLATDPLEEMLAHLRERHPDLRVAQAPAEAVPVATRSVDTVVAGSSAGRSPRAARSSAAFASRTALAAAVRSALCSGSSMSPRGRTTAR